MRHFCFLKLIAGSEANFSLSVPKEIGLGASSFRHFSCFISFGNRPSLNRQSGFDCPGDRRDAPQPRPAPLQWSVLHSWMSPAVQHGRPESLRSDNGLEFCSRRTLGWAEERKIALVHHRRYRLPGFAAVVARSQEPRYGSLPQHAHRPRQVGRSGGHEPVGRHRSAG
jgi:hypothetical protein